MRKLNVTDVKEDDKHKISEVMGKFVVAGQQEFDTLREVVVYIQKLGNGKPKVN